MERSDFSKALVLVLGTGLLVRLGLAFATYGVAFDIGSFEVVRGELASDPLGLYGSVNGITEVSGIRLDRWPYPPGFLPWIAAAGVLTGSGLPFHGLVQLPSIAADLLLALVAQDYLGRRGASASRRLMAAGLIALGPAFIAVSGYHGQIDSTAILPAAMAIYLWDRLEPGWRRTLACGLLVGVGASIKTVPIVMLIPLLPHCRSFREGAALVGVAVAVPAAMLLPFAIADPSGVETLRDYRGAPGAGGLSLVLQPGLAGVLLTQTGEFDLNLANELLFDHGTKMFLLVLTGVFALLLRFRPPAVVGASLVWLAFYVFGGNYFSQYLVWGLPFFVMAGYLREVAAAQLLALVPTILAYMAPWEGPELELVYAPLMILLWVCWLVAAVVLLQQIRRRRWDGLVGGDPGLSQPAPVPGTG